MFKLKRWWEKGSYQGHMFLIHDVDLFLCCVLSLFPFPPVQDGITPLYVACQNGHKQIVIVLLKNGANVNLTTTVSSLSGAYSELSSWLYTALICMYAISLLSTPLLQYSM